MKSMESMKTTFAAIGGYGIQLHLDYRNRQLTHANLNPIATRIDLRHNLLTDFQDWPSEFPYLTHLRLDHNQFDSLTDLPYMPKLEFLSLGHNRLTGDITADLQHIEKMCPQLTILNLNFNDITHLYIPYTMMLCARSNHITHFTGPSIVNVIGYCHLGQNRIKSFDKLSYMPRLNMFFTNNNPIETLKGLPLEVIWSIIGTISYEDYLSWNILDAKEREMLEKYFADRANSDFGDFLSMFYLPR